MIDYIYAFYCWCLIPWAVLASYFITDIKETKDITDLNCNIGRDDLQGMVVVLLMGVVSIYFYYQYAREQYDQRIHSSRRR